MPTPALTRLAAAALLALPLTCAIAQACDMNELGSVPVSYRGRGLDPTIAGSINGQPTQVMVKLGTNVSTLNKRTLDKFGVPIKTIETSTPGYELQSANASKLTVGPHTARGWMTVVDATETDIGVHAGANMLLKSDLEISLPDGYLKFFRPTDCRKASLAYWDPKAYVVPFDVDQSSTDNRPFLKVRINGHEVDAIISTSSDDSYMDSLAAARMGITPQSPGAVAAGTVRSWRNQKQKVWLVPVQSIEMGNYKVNNVKLRILDMTLSGELMVLGMDFLRSHRILISPSQRKMYLTSPKGEFFNEKAEQDGPWFRAEAERGGADAQAELAETYAWSDSAANTRMALEWFEKSAAQGNGHANMRLGHIAFQNGEFAKSARHLRVYGQQGRAAALNPAMLFAAASRAGDKEAAKELAAARSTLKAGGWTDSVLSFMEGKMTQDALLAMAVKDPAQKSDRLCSANFYVGQAHLVSGNAPLARPFLETVKADCGDDFDHRLAVAELLRMDRAR